MPRLDALGDGAGRHERDERIERALVLLGQLGLAGGRRCAPAGGDVGVLREVEAVEAPGLGLAGDIGRCDRPIGQEQRHPEAHDGDPTEFLTTRQVCVGHPGLAMASVKVAPSSSPEPAVVWAGHTRWSSAGRAPTSSSTTSVSTRRHDRPTRRVVDLIRDEAAGGAAVASAPTWPTGSGRRDGRPAVDTFGGLDVVVNNAGFLRDRMFVNSRARGVGRPSSVCT